jgi:hypothetical protein
MNFDDYISDVRSRLTVNHGNLFCFFESEEDELAYCPSEGAWTGAEILEHVGLTSHYLLILIDKASAKARRKADGKDLTIARLNFTHDPRRLESIGRHKSFVWDRPNHMEPTGTVTMNAVADQLADQLQRCLRHLDELEKGEGLFYTTMMSVDDLGRLNVYEYIDFLSQHIKRHTSQISGNLTAFELSDF